MSDPASAAYLMGRSEHERRRLRLQASILNPLTERFLLSAGLVAGMRVLDLGCGIGDVSLIAARIAGPDGHVTGIDADEEALATARTRAKEENQQSLIFERNDFSHHVPEQPYDAVVGRHVLIHTASPGHVIRTAASFLRPGGIMAFQEYDLSFYPSGFPEHPLAEKLQTMLVRMFGKASPHANIGMRLINLMQEAGLSDPRSRAECLIDAGPDTLFCDWLAETVRSVLPAMQKLGIAAPGEIDLETLADRLRDEIRTRRGCLTTPLIVSTFARKTQV